MITLETKLSELTVGELLNILSCETKPETRKVVKGIAGIAEIFGVSVSTAKRIKTSGVINEAISQSGRIIVTDVEKAQALFHKATHARRR